MPYRYVVADPVRTITKNGRRRASQEIVSDLKVSQWRHWLGIFGSGAGNVSLLVTSRRVNYFVYRDPRDMLVSQVFYATDMAEEHGMHAYYNPCLTSVHASSRYYRY